MPNYDYKCLTCDKKFDKVVSIENRDEQTCEDCGEKVERQITFGGMVWAPTAGGWR